jgi:hypothetical protein
MQKFKIKNGKILKTPDTDFLQKPLIRQQVSERQDGPGQRPENMTVIG